MNNITLINFVDLTIEEKKMVLSWRNHPDIKRWMYTDSDISLENHLNFIDSLKDRKDKLYFLVKKDDEYIGVINFTDIKVESLEMGIYSRPSAKGLGSILLKTIIEYAFDTLKIKRIFAEVFSENSRAYNLYKKYGFNEIGKNNINNKEVIRLELKNENR